MSVVDPSLDYEKALWEQGFFYIAGIDEAGRGAWAGPVSAGAVILPVDKQLLELLPGARDSKMMSPEAREKLYLSIKDVAVSWAVGEATHEEIDRIGILNATKLAMQRAIDDLEVSPQYLLVDYLRLPGQSIPQQGIKHGDMLSLSIACASIMAKVTRDHWMSQRAAARYPQYGFEKHKGYGTKLHQEALAKYGPCPIHRMTFRPLAVEEKLF